MKILNHRDNSVYFDFGNGICMSTIWGYLSYSDAHDGKGAIAELHNPIPETGMQTVDKFYKRYESTTVEMMLTKCPKDFGEQVMTKYKEYTTDSENFEGPFAYLPLKEWFEIVDMARKYKKS